MTEILTDVDRMLIERACDRLVQQYCHFVDRGEAVRIADLFTEDGVWTSPDNTMTGIDEIRAGFQRRQNATHRRSRHVCTNLLIDVQDAGTATGVVYLTLYRHDDKADASVRPSEVPEIVGEYRDTFVRTDDGWRFSRREIGVDFSRGA
ncbi:nuclear transport factor 2 family protein [Minwuia sp.]|uniref:nuclear transport factor 2 family protein n=1 Tax=Minwuia sp. TaxID=2493630 RepID=UPI003A94557F